MADESRDIRSVAIDEEMRGSYLDYAMSVIVARALPDARDGLKPVHRRILFAMHEMGLRHNTRYRKSARVVGDVLGKYHPHGDGAVYEAMARMAQEFSLRYPLVDGQGNFGSVDGDRPAAMRYTEVRLMRIAAELLRDIDMDTVDFGENYDGSAEEPHVLPARMPNLLLNGASGIAVGMATNIPPHNLRELAAAICHLIDNQARLAEVSVDELMQFVPGPDFPTGAIIGPDQGLREAYATGNGRVLVQAKTEIEMPHNGRPRIVISEIPYQVSKTALIERIVALTRAGRIEGIADLRDESDRAGMRLTVELRRDAVPQLVRNQLFKFTQLRMACSIRMLALVNLQPRMLGLRQALQLYIEHRHEVIARRSRHELGKLRARAHVLEGLLRALEQIDEIIATVRGAADSDDARAQLMANFALGEEQAGAILEMQLRRLAALERQKLQEEYDAARERIAWLEELLASRGKILALVREETQELAGQYGDARRTALDATICEEFDEADLIRDERVLISLTAQGYIKRAPAAAYPPQRRGGKGRIGMIMRDDDALLDILTAGSHDQLLFFSDRGKVYCRRAWSIPEIQLRGRGIAIAAILPLEAGERITTILPISDFAADGRHLMLATRQGRIKRVPLAQFVGVRASGLIAIHLGGDDTLVQVRPTDGGQELMLVTEGGQSIRFHEDEVRVMGRTAAGVRSIRLREPGDRVAAMDAIEAGDTHQLIITQFGYGKRTALDAWNQQARLGVGVRTLARNEVTGPVVAMRCIRADQEILVMTSSGVILRTRLSEIRATGRNTRGVRVIDLAEGGSVVGLAVLDIGDEAGSDERNGGRSGEHDHD